MESVNNRPSISANPTRGLNPKGECMKVSAIRNGKMIIKVSEVKEAAGDGFRISEEFYYELDRQVNEIIEEAKRRAKKNGRRTIKPYDL